MSVLCWTMKPFMISAEETWILKDPPTPTWTDWLPKLSHHWPPHWDSMELWMLMLLNSKPTWSHIQESTSCCHHMPPLSLLKKLIMNNYQLLKSLTPHLNLPTWWLNVILDTENTWPAPWCIEVMLSLKTSMPPLQPSKPKELSNLLIGAQLDSKSELTTNPQLSSQVETWPKLWELSAWSPTQLPLLKYSLDWITNSIWCMPREPLYIGT